jgi:hypothetical protein
MSVTRLSFLPSLIALTLTLGLVACTKATPWAGQGTEGYPCFPEGTCNSGLICKNGVCQSPATPRIDSGPVVDTLFDSIVLPPSDQTVVLPDGTGCQTPAPPTLDGVPANTPHEKVAIRGRVGVAVDALEVITSASTKTINVDGGSFCIEVELIKGQQTRIEIFAISGACRSDQPAVATIRQDDTSQQLNLLAGVPPYAENRQPAELIELTDGKTTSAVTFSFSDIDVPPNKCDNSTYVYFGLSQAMMVSKLVIRYPQEPGFDDYLQCWTLLGSGRQNIPRDSQWEVWGQDTQTQESRELVIDITPAKRARHLTLVMMENGTEFFATSEVFRFTEIEAYGPPVAVPPYVGCQ